MIKIVIPSRIIKVDWKANKWPPLPKKTLEEAHRRDKLIKELAAQAKYVAGDTCVPTTDQGKEMYGECYVRGIAKNYAQYGNVDWPDDDSQPMIVTAWSLKTKSEFVCTVNYLENLRVEEINAGI